MFILPDLMSSAHSISELIGTLIYHLFLPRYN